MTGGQGQNRLFTFSLRLHVFSRLHVFRRFLGEDVFTVFSRLHVFSRFFQPCPPDTMELATIVPHVRRCAAAALMRSVESPVGRHVGLVPRRCSLPRGGLWAIRPPPPAIKAPLQESALCLEPKGYGHTNIHTYVPNWHGASVAGTAVLQTSSLDRTLVLCNMCWIVCTCVPAPSVPARPVCAGAICASAICAEWGL